MDLLDRLCGLCLASRWVHGASRPPTMAGAASPQSRAPPTSSANRGSQVAKPLCAGCHLVRRHYQWRETTLMVQQATRPQAFDGAAVADLRTRLRGEIILPSDEHYDRARAV